MSNCACCGGHEHHNTNVRVETITLDDGRRAERHVSIDSSGNEVVEIFAEEKRPLKLEKRIQREMKTVVAKETHETVRDGEVVMQEVRSMEADAPLQIRSKIGVADHAKVVDGDYVRKEEINKIVADSVVAGVSALMESMQPVIHKNEPEPIFKAQSVVEKNVEAKKAGDLTTIVVLAVLFVAQAGFIAYAWFAN